MPRQHPNAPADADPPLYRLRHHPALLRLARINRTGIFLAGLALMLAALFAPGIVGGFMLLTIAAGLGVLLAATWPVQAPATRLLRVAVLGLIVAAALSKIL